MLTHAYEFQLGRNTPWMEAPHLQIMKHYFRYFSVLKKDSNQSFSIFIFIALFGITHSPPPPMLSDYQDLMVEIKVSEYTDLRVFPRKFMLRSGHFKNFVIQYILNFAKFILRFLFCCPLCVNCQYKNFNLYKRP